MSEPSTVALPSAAEDVVRNLLDAAEKYDVEGFIGRRAIEQLLDRGYPDALLIPPASLEAYRRLALPSWRRMPWRMTAAVIFAFAVIVSIAVVGGASFRVLPRRPTADGSRTIECFRDARSAPDRAAWAEHTGRIRVRWETDQGRPSPSHLSMDGKFVPH